jgi:Xaa-Pro dipeptidase
VILFDYDKAARLMAAHGMDVLLPNSLLNAGYLADHWKHELVSSFGAYLTGDDGVPYLLLVGLPRDPQIEPFVTCRTGGEESDMSCTDVWIEDKRRWGPSLANREATAPFGPYDRVYDNPLDAAADALRERGLDRGTIGVESRFLGVEPYHRLEYLLPQARFVDALPLLNELRMVKSGEEVRRMRVAARATERAIEAALATVVEGITGLDLERVVGASHYLAGVRHEWLHTCIGPGGAHVICPSDVPVDRGHVVRLDAGASCRHYQSDISRVGVLGEPSARLLKVHAAMRRALEAVVEAARPGVTAGHLYDVGNTVVESGGFENFLTIVGHGVGRDIHEMPFLQRGDLTVLQPGMTLAIELATMSNELGCIALEDEILITLDGSEPLSTTGRELYITE